MKSLILFLTFFAFAASASGQNKGGTSTDTLKVKKPLEEEITEPVSEPEIFVVVEDMPMFPGGNDSMNKFIQAHLEYPDSAHIHGIQGKVIVEFVIDEEGRLINPKIVKGIGWGCDEEVLRVVRMMPNWTPGKQRGKPVKVQYRLPIKFQMR